MAVKSTKAKTQLRKPKGLRLEGARAFAQRIVRENKEWFKEMANK